MVPRLVLAQRSNYNNPPATIIPPAAGFHHLISHLILDYHYRHYARRPLIPLTCPISLFKKAMNEQTDISRGVYFIKRRIRFESFHGVVLVSNSALALKANCIPSNALSPFGLMYYKEAHFSSGLLVAESSSRPLASNTYSPPAPGTKIPPKQHIPRVSPGGRHGKCQKFYPSRIIHFPFLPESA